jgi:hypothetical protein
MKYYADNITGKLLGGFEGSVPENAIEVPTPEMGGAYWINGKWDYTIPLSTSIRQERDELLSKSDISVLPDRWASMTSEQQQQLSQYRQELRDITSQNGFPHDINWPTKP